MRQFHSCQQQQQQQHHQHPQAKAKVTARAPGSSAAPAADGALDQAASLWTTRRIRSYFQLLDRTAGTPRR